MSEYSCVCVCVCVCVPAHACVHAFLHILILPVKSGKKKNVIELEYALVCFNPCLQTLLNSTKLVLRLHEFGEKLIVSHL